MAPPSKDKRSPRLPYFGIDSGALKRFVTYLSSGPATARVADLKPRDIGAYYMSILRGDDQTLDHFPLSQATAEIRVIVSEGHLRILKRFLTYCRTRKYLGEAYRTMVWSPSALAVLTL